MPPAYVKPYVKRNKTDARDAEAICEAVCRPTMRFVPVKSEAQQASRALHRVRDLLVRQRTQLANVIRGLSAEFGMVEPVGTAGFAALVARLAQNAPEDAPAPGTGLDASACPVPAPLREILIGLAQQWRELSAKIDDLAHRIVAAGKERRAGAPPDGGARRRPDAVARRELRGAGCLAVQVGARLFRLDRADAAAELERRANAGSARSRGQATRDCGGSSCSAPPPWCARPASGPIAPIPGWSPCWRAGRPRSPSWRSPPKPRGSSSP